MMNTHDLQNQQAIVFPDPPEPEGATPATIGPVYPDGWDLFDVPAVGAVMVEPGERHHLKLGRATPGQLASLLRSPGASVIDMIDIGSGAVSNDDLSAISSSNARMLQLGIPRDGLAEPEPGELHFVDGPDLSVLMRVEELAVDYVPFSDEHLATLGATGLSSLRLAGTGADLGCLDRFGYLGALHLEGENVGRDLSSLVGMNFLKCLDVRFTSLTADQLLHLQACPSLVILGIGYNPTLGPDLSPVGDLRGLIHLDVSSTAVDDTTLPTIGSLGQLRSFYAGLTEITDDGVASVGQWPALRDLMLAGTRITDAGLARIVEACPQLTRLDLRSTEVTESGLAQHLVRLPHLRELGADGHVLSGDLADRLKEHTSIKHLVIGSRTGGGGWIEAVDRIGSAGGVW